MRPNLDKYFSSYGRWVEALKQKNKHLCLPVLGEDLNSPGKADVGDVRVKHALPLKPRSNLMILFVCFPFVNNLLLICFTFSTVAVLGVNSSQPKEMAGGQGVEARLLYLISKLTGKYFSQLGKYLINPHVFTLPIHLWVLITKKSTLSRTAFFCALSSSWQLWVPSTTRTMLCSSQKLATVSKGRIRPLWLDTFAENVK